MSIFQTVVMQAAAPTKAPSARPPDDHLEFAARLKREGVEVAPKGTVIVVNDNANILDLIGEILRHSGFAAHSAIDAASALDVLGSVPNADLLLIDADMPGIDGIVLADMIKARCPMIHVLYMANQATKVEAKFGICHGPTIRKPFLADQLVTAVRQSCLGIGRSAV